MSKEEILEGNKLIAEFDELGYSINEIGEVIGVKGWKLKLHKGSCGYLQITTWRNYKQRTFLVHRLVASKYIPNPNKLPEVNHKDGNKMNNHKDNLEWCTRSSNILHGFKNKLITPAWLGKKGNNHPASNGYNKNKTA